jgi:hypothetical protein
MSYTIRHTPEAEEKIRGWGLTKRQIDEMRFRLLEDLGENPAKDLRPVKNEPDYMEYMFASALVVSGARWLFAFRVVYSRDRESLVILDADHLPLMEP